LGDPNHFLDPIHVFKNCFSTVHRSIGPALFGPCHGDFHGRNILVCLKKGKAIGAVAFDYEKMSMRRPIAWELVKLEMELKVRLLESVIQERVKSENYRFPMIEFELELNKATWQLGNGRIVPPEEFPSASKRLFEILLEIRRIAAQVLSPKRSGGGIAEYLLTTAAYAVRTSKYAERTIKSEAYDIRMLEIAYIAGGSALAHLHTHHPLL
jgi:hypothetical protein